MTREDVRGEFFRPENVTGIDGWVRDLEAAPQPERRTITREEFRAAQEQVWRAQDIGENAAAMLERVADVWRLTVEK